MDHIQPHAWIFILLCVSVQLTFSSMNIARGKAATQSSDFSLEFTAVRAVDGIIAQFGIDRDVGCGCCSHTAVGARTAWWQVDLAVLSTIRRIRIIYRQFYSFRLAGYFLYVTNSSGSPDVLCYRDPISATLPNPIQDLQCKYTARYVYIYNERLNTVIYPINYDVDALMELCEVEVYGCPLGKYDTDCNANCSNGCKDESYICDPDTGNCASGCKDGFVGLQCNVCVKGKYGENCNTACPAICFNDTCDRATGDCALGCERNFNGTKCEKCSNGRYGSMCDKVCSIGCEQGICEQNGGRCNFGCVAGFQGASCKDCIKGRHGGNCERNCSNSCNGMQCQRLTGECTNGCSTGWEGVSCTVPTSTGSSSGQPVPPSTVAGVVVGILLILGLVLVGLIFMKRRSVGIFSNSRDDNKAIMRYSQDFSLVNGNKSNSHKSEDARNSTNQVNSRAAKYDRNDVYENTPELYCNVSLPGIPVNEIKHYVAQKTRRDFEKEYKKLPEGPKFAHVHTRKPENRIKNRFQNPYCYDHSRVMLTALPDQPDSDFINANYIDRVDREKFYIAAQGPKENTVTDFWRMVWQVNSSVIVMLTNLVEMGKVKCEQYWPEVGQTLDAGPFTIITDDVQEYFNFSLRQILITDKNDDTSRKILHYHFTSWPDHGTPDHTEIILFQRKVAAQYTNVTGPIIVHCSAGVGRTGTFIALDALLEYGNRTGTIDILGFVKTMRKDRVNMIQTIEQYIFLNEVMVKAFEFEDTSLTRQSLHDLFENQSGTESLDTVYTNCVYLPRIEKEFQDLQMKKQPYSDKDYKIAVTKVNKNKNKDGCPLALDKYIPFVNTRVPDGTNYINAVVLPAFNRKNGYIVSNSPLQNTDVDLWSVIVDHQCKTLVIFNVDESDKSSSWLPLHEDVINVGPFTIKKEVEEIEQIEHTKIYIFSISEKGRISDFKIKVYMLTSWTNGGLCSSERQVVKLVELVDDWTQSRGSGTITVICPDGVTTCGIFCVVHDVIGSFRTNGEADIYQTVRRMQCRRPECIPSIEQYQFCYEVSKEFLNNDNVYANN